MAIANFFDKIALGASQLLKNYNQESFQRILLSHRIMVYFDEKTAESYEGKVTIELLIRLLSRLYPNLQIKQNVDGDIEQRLIELAKQINPEINTAAVEPSACIVVGQSKCPFDVPCFYIGSDSWVSHFSPNNPVITSNSNNPIGAAASACFGVANLFRLIFREQLPYSETDEAFSLSLLDFSYGNLGQGSILPKISIKDTTLVGLGAIGNGVSWTLAKIENIDGGVNLVDHEPVSLSNLQRYILCDQNSIGKPKVEIAENFLTTEKLKANPINKKWKQHISENLHSKIETIAVCVDNPDDRIFIQGILPKKLFNAWTQQENLGVSRHIDFVNAPCVCCLYLPTTAKKSRSQEIADNLNLSGSERIIRNYLANRKPLDEALLNLIAQANEIPVEKFKQFLNGSIEIFYSEVVCGGLLISNTNSCEKQNQNMEVPCAFESALSGILLAAELIKESIGYNRDEETTTTRFNLIRSNADYLNFSENKKANCICADPIFKEVYREKWN